MENLSLPENIKTSENVLFQEINGEYVLLNMESEQYFGLDEVGARIWQLLSEEETSVQILEHLENEYEVDPQILRRDFVNLVEELKSEDLVTAGNK